MSCLVVISHCLHRLPRALLGVLVLVIWMVGAGSASAAAYTWNVAGGGSWGNSANWAPVGVPGTGDTVAIGLVTGGSTITLDGNRSVVSLALSSTNSHVIAAGTSGSLTLTSTGTAISITAAGTPTFSCPMVLGASQTWASGTVSPLVSGVVSGAFTLTTSGSWKFTGNNTFTQGVAVSSGTLIAAANNALGTIAAGTTVASGGSLGFEGGITYSTAEAVTLNGVGAASDGAMVNVSGTNSFAGAVTLASDATIGSRAGALTLSGTVNQGVCRLTTAGASALTVSGIVSGTAGLSKNGAGTTTLSAANTYAGFTDVNDGTLLVTNASGSGTGTSFVQVYGGTLGGSGTISGAVEIKAGASLAPGSGGAGTLTISKASATALSLAYNAALNYELGTASDLIALTGTSANLTLDGTVNVTAGSGFAVGTYTLITYTGTCTDLTLAVGSMPSGFAGTVSVNTTASPRRVDLVVTAARYWVGGSGNWSDTARWSTSSGGSGGATVPGATTSAIFDGSSGAGTATVDVAATAYSVRLVSGYTGTLTVGSGNSLTTSGIETSVTVAAGATLINQGTLSISGTGTAMNGTFTASAVGNLVRFTGQADNAAVKIPTVAYHHLDVAKAGTTFTFSGGIYREYYGGIGGGDAVSDLTSAGIYPNSPTQTGVITDWFEGPADIAENYGTRMRALVIPPTTGNYYFWIASDDQSEVWVAADGIAANAIKVAQVNFATGPRNWTSEANQQSSAIALVAGQPCYVMALHKEGGGGDYLAVGWTGPSSLDERPIPASRCNQAFSGSGATIIAGNLTISAGTLGASSATLSVAGNLANTGSFTSGSGGSVSVAGNWTNTGTFTAGSGTVVLAGAGGSTQVISGSTTFNHLSAACTAARTVQFVAGTTQTVGGNLVLTGASGQLLSLTSGTPGSTWNLNPTAGVALQTCAYLNVRDGTNLDAAYILPTNSVDGGNTVRWFLTANTWISAGPGLWNTASNWSLTHVPTALETATFTSAFNGSCTLDLATQVAGRLVFSPGYGGTFALGDKILDITASHADFTGLTALTGTGTVRFSSTGFQQMTPNSLSHANISHTGSGTLTLLGNLSCQSLSNSSGYLNVNGKNITTTGSLTISNGTTTTVANIGGVTMTVGGDASLSGQVGNLLNLSPSTGSAWFIRVSGALSANYAVIGSSDASDGVAGYATNSSDLGRNINWGFGSTTFYWHQSQPLASTDFNRACNWTSGVAGGGRRPASGRDDQFSVSALDTGVWTFRDNINDGYSSQSLLSNTGRLTMTARGQEVFGTVFDYAGVHRSDLTGNAFDVTVYVESMTNTDNDAKAGIMAMNNVTDTSQGGIFLLAIKPNNRAEILYPSTVNGTINTFASIAMTAPCYLRLARNGTSFTGFCKKNISDAWTVIGSAVTPAGTAAGTPSQIMLITCSKTTSATCTAVFDDFQAGTVMSASDNILSFNGLGTGKHANATMSANQTVAVVDFSGSNGYAGTYDFNGRTLAVGPGTGSGATETFDTTDAQTGTITAQGDNGANELKENAFDNNVGSKWLDFANGFPATRSSWIQYVYPGATMFAVSSYSLTSASDADDRDPRDWRIFGVDGLGAETLLDTQAGQTFASRGLKKSYAMANTTAYRGYKLVIDSVKTPGPGSANSMQLAEIEFLGVNPAVAAGSASFNQSTLTLAATGGGTLAFVGSIAHQFTPKSGGIFPSLLLSGSGGTTLITNDLILSGNVTIASGNFDSGGKNITVAGNWSSNATFTAGSGTVTLSGASATTQTISATTTTLGRQFSLLQVTGGAAVALADAANANALTIATASAFTLSGSPLTLRSGALSRTDVTGAEGLHTLSCNVVLEAAGTWTNSTTDSQLAVTGVVSGAFALTTQGAGTINLSGANTYSGGTTVAAGTLLASNGSGSATGSGAVSIASGATLGGTGSLAGAVTVQNGGIVAPGVAGAGTVTLTAASATALALNATSVLNVDLGTSSDLIACSGTAAALTLDGNVNITAGAGFAAGTYTIITYSGTLTDNTLMVGTRPSGWSATIRTSVSGQVQVVILADAAGVNEIWTGAGGVGDTNWTTNANWSDSSYPDVGDNISFPDVTNQTVSMNVAATVGTITFNAADAYTVGGASALTLGGTVTQSGAGTVAISAPVATGNSARTFTGAGSGQVTLSGVLSGSGLQTFAAGAWSLANAANSFSGGVTVTGGTVLLQPTTANTSVNVNAGSTTSHLGNVSVGAITINGGRILVSPTGTGVIGTSGGVWPSIAMGTAGGTFDLAGAPLVTTAAVGNNERFAFDVAAASGTPGILSRSYASGNASNGWLPDTGWVALTTLGLTGNLNLALSNGAGALWTNSSRTFAGSLIVSGHDNGSAAANLSAAAGAKTSVTVGRLAIFSDTADTWTAGSLRFVNTVQVAPLDSASANTLDADMTVATSAAVAFQGSAHTARNPLVLGASNARALTISDGGTALLSWGAGASATDFTNLGGVTLTARTTIAGGGTLRLPASSSVVNANLINGDITGQGTTAKEAVLDIQQDVGSGTNATTFATPDGAVTASGADLIVAGTGDGGLKVQGTAARLAGALTAARLSAVIGTGGYLSIAPADGTHTLPSTSQWSDIDIGLRVVDSYALGTDLALSDAAVTWARAITIDTGAVLGVGHATTATSITGGIAGAGGMTKTGAATTTLATTACAFTGPLTVSAGTLVANTTCSGGGAVTVANAATLAGTGSLAGAVSIGAGGILAPGSGGAGMLTITKASATALALNATSVLNVDLGTASDLVACSGLTSALTLAGTVNVTAGAGFAATTYTLITYTGSLTNNTLAVGTMPAGFAGSIDTSTAGQVKLVCSTLAYTARETNDSTGNGRIDRIRLTTTGTLNDDFSGMTAAVTGYTVTGFSTGAVANDNEFFIVFTEGGSADTAATPAVQITANSSLRPAGGAGLYGIDAVTATPADKARPVLIASTWTDGDANGVDAGDTIALTFSEAVTTSSMVVANLGLPVSGDSLATSTIANQAATTTVTVVLAGAPQVTPGGTYASGATTVGAASGVHLGSGANVSDAAANTGYVQSGASAVDLGPTTATAISIAWETGSDPKLWAIGSVLAGTAHNTVATPDLRVRNLSTGAVQLLVKTAASSPSGWTPAGAAGSNAFLMKCDHAGTASVGAGPTTAANYALTLTANNQIMHSLVYSGLLADFELYFAAPSTITIGGGRQQTITVTITAQVPP